MPMTLPCQSPPKWHLGDDAEGNTASPSLPLYADDLEEPFASPTTPAALRFELEYFEAPAPKILINPHYIGSCDQMVTLEEAILFECAQSRD